jgi:hypothetical protein
MRFLSYEVEAISSEEWVTLHGFYDSQLIGKNSTGYYVLFSKGEVRDLVTPIQPIPLDRRGCTEYENFLVFFQEESGSYLAIEEG